MANLEANVSLKAHHTFHFDVRAEWLGFFSSVQELEALLKEVQEKDLEMMVLGGGSNVLFTQDVTGAVLINQIEGIKAFREDSDHIWVKSGAGENWHQFVLHCIAEGWAGVENLSLIPGSVGASPMQNIGAYGVEIKDVFDHLEAYNLKTGKIERFEHADCAFGYRESVFKRALKDQYIITQVAFRLDKNPQFKTSYGAIQDELLRMGIEELSIQAVSNAVVAIRQSKLPNPDEIGNAGSFFKNPVISNIAYEKLKALHPKVSAYPAGEGLTKIAAGWLIDQAGWKGKTLGNYGVHKKQALVLVNYGGAQGNEVYDLSQAIMDDVLLRYGIQLEREVNIY